MRCTVSLPFDSKAHIDTAFCSVAALQSGAPVRLVLDAAASPDIRLCHSPRLKCTCSTLSHLRRSRPSGHRPSLRTWDRDRAGVMGEDGGGMCRLICLMNALTLYIRTSPRRLSSFSDKMRIFDIMIQHLAISRGDASMYECPLRFSGLAPQPGPGVIPVGVFYQMIVRGLQTRPFRGRTELLRGWLFQQYVHIPPSI